MNQAGIALLAIAALASLTGLAFSLLGEIRRRPLWTRIGHLSIYAVLAGSAGAMLLLLAAFLAHDFGNVYVYEHSSRALSAVYTISALWAGNAGSLLLWLLLLAIFTTIACRRARRRDPGFAAMATAVLSAMTLFFSLLILFGPQCDPFAANAVTPTPLDGLGLNPQLENPGMIIHPLALYVGYVALAVPFALMIAGLVRKQPTDSWLTATRAWVLVAWLFLTIGNVVGRLVGVCESGLGRLLGMGPGGERLPHPLAHGHSAATRGEHLPAEEQAEALDGVASGRLLPPDRLRDVPHPYGSGVVGPRLRRIRA